MSKKYYPYLPWNDDNISYDSITRDDIAADSLISDNISYDRITREGIYGPLAQIFRYLTAQDNKLLIADTRAIGTLETA